MNRFYDVIIGGAGFSGLSAGLHLKDNGINNFLILEARDKVGGRCSNDIVKLDNGKICVVDSGGAYIGPKQYNVLKMVKRYNMKTHKVYTKGKSVITYNNKIYDNVENVPPNDTLSDLEYITQETDKLAQQIDTFNINKSKLDIFKYDNISVTQWIESTINNKEAQEIYKTYARSLLCMEPDKASILFWLYLVKSGGSLNDLMETENGAQDSKIIGGAYMLTENMRNEIENNVKLNHRITAIEQCNNYCKVICRNVSFKAKYVIMAIQPASYKTIEWKPKLCLQREMISNQMNNGHVIKTYTFFKTPFWRQNGYNGSMLTCGSNNNYPVIATFDACKPDNSCFALMGFIGAEKAKNYILHPTKIKKKDRKKAILKMYSKIFKMEKEIIENECIGYFEKGWKGFASVPSMNVMSKSYYHIIKKDENDIIHFACTELGDQWICYMDGAIQCGQREAQKIIQKLNNNAPSNIYSKL